MNAGSEGREVTLPELSDARIDEMEQSLFADIGAERVDAERRRSHRGRWWIAGGAAAAVVAVAAIIAPSLGGLVTGASSGESAAEPAYDMPLDGAAQSADSGAGDSAVEESAGGRADADGDLAGADGRAIITTASVAITVEDVEAAARTVGNAAIAHGGYVEAMEVGTTGQQMPMEEVPTDTVPYPYVMDGAWVTVRVPSTEVAPMIDELADAGEVTSSSINRADVTAQTVDLQARVDAARESVERLTELMSEAGDLTDLIAAESALAERQATLEMYEQELEMLDDQVEMSAITVSLSPVVEQVVADPAGFGDGLAAGWNGLVATLNGIVIALGFLLPWIVVVGAAGAVIWLIVRSVKRRRSRADAD